MSIRLGFCSNAYTRYPLEEAIDRIATHGYAAVEILCDVPHYWPPAAAPQRAAALADRLAHHALAVSNVNANTAVGFYDPVPDENVFGPTLASPDPRARRQRIEHVGAAIDLAARLGSANVSITSGACGSDHPPEAALDTLRDSLREVLTLAREAGVRVGLEAEPGLLLETSQEVADLCDELDDPLLGFNLDVGHAVVGGEDPAALIRRHGSRIWHLHLEDIRDGKHYHLVPGQGDVDFVAIANALRGVAFEGFASVEVYPYKRDPDDAARASLAALGPLFDD
jgi:protein FrlC